VGADHHHAAIGGGDQRREHAVAVAEVLAVVRVQLDAGGLRVALAQGLACGVDRAVGTDRGVDRRRRRRRGVDRGGGGGGGESGGGGVPQAAAITAPLTNIQRDFIARL
jgi:uncharacterized membrane protein YgcG